MPHVPWENGDIWKQLSLLDALWALFLWDLPYCNPLMKIMIIGEERDSMYIVPCETLMIYIAVIKYGGWTPKENIFAPKDEDFPNMGFMPPIGWDY